MGGKSNSDAADPATLISRKTGNWWQDSRRQWCAYCGASIDFNANKSGDANATRDHVIPKSHNAGGMRIPACRACNVARASKSLPEFLNSEHFNKVRKSEQCSNAWSLRDLWLVLAYAAVEQAYRHSDEWPDALSGKGKSG